MTLGLKTLACMYCKTPSDLNPPGWLLNHHVLHCERRECIGKCPECADDFEAIGGPEVTKVDPSVPRKIYETAKDREVQRTIITEVCDAWGLGQREMPALHPFDFLLTKDEAAVVGAEVKSRNVYFRTYDDIILSEHKVNRAVSLLRVESLPFLFIVRFVDGIWWTELYSPGEGVAKLEKRAGGRTDRNDALDVETCVVIPSPMFRPINERYTWAADVEEDLPF